MADAKGRARYPEIVEEDWAALGYIGLSDEIKHGMELDMRGMGLEGEIHDLFQYNINGRPMPIWQNQTRGQYQAILAVLQPVFRLATNLLLCPASLDWFYHLIYAPRTLTDPLVQHNGDDVYEYRRDGTPMKERHEKAKAALQRLASTHTISLKDFDAGQYDEGSTGIGNGAAFFEQGVNIKDGSARKKSGVGFHTAIDRGFVRQLMEFCMEGFDSRTRMFVLGTKMAVTWIHEFAHGAGMASNARLLGAVKRELFLRSHADANHYQRHPEAFKLNEDLFEDENHAEPGYSWESFVFGGIIELLNCDPSNPLVFIKWPNFLKGDRDLRRGGFKQSATQWIVPKQWIINVNSQKWWDSVEENDTTALYIKKMMGIRVYRPSRNLDRNWSTSDSSEGVWQTDEEHSQDQAESSRVSRVRLGMTPEDPSKARANELPTRPSNA